MNPDLEPINKQVVLQLVEEEDNHGIIIPEQIRKKYLATIFAVGPNVAQASVGDLVAFRPQLVFDLDLYGKKFMICEENSLVCIVRKKP